MNTASQPLLLPSRQLNEFVYCPRLFYYEFVEGVFVHNADTVAGQAAHKRVNAREQGLPGGKGEDRKKKVEGKTVAKTSGNAETEAGAPDGTGSAEEPLEAFEKEPEVIHSRSVQLYSDKLGVTAKLDLVESTRAADDLWDRLVVTPVEYKKGRPREGEDGPEIWDADKMQLGLQILLLRENGYICEEGVLYYRETRQRVPFPMTVETEAWILATIEEARACTQGPIPPPLAHSSKCPRCSLVSICLPDETAYLDELRAHAAPKVSQLGLEGLFKEEDITPSGTPIIPTACTGGLLPICPRYALSHSRPTMTSAA